MQLVLSHFLCRMWNVGQGLFYFCLWIFSCSRTICWKNCQFSIVLLLYHYQKSIVLTSVHLFLGLYPVPLIYMFIPLPTSHSLYHCGYIIIKTIGLKVGELIPSTLFLLVKIILSILVPLHFCRNFRVTLYISTKKILMGCRLFISSREIFFVIKFLGFHVISHGDNFISSFLTCMCFIYFYLSYHLD